MKSTQLADIQFYLSTQYLTLAQLSEKSETPANRIRDYLSAGCILGAAYESRTAHTFKTHIFGETTIGSEEPTLYFSPATLEWVRRANALFEKHDGNLRAVAQEAKTDFGREFESAVDALAGSAYGFSECYVGGCLDPQSFAEVTEQKWDHVLKGTYGVCTRNPTNAYEIARKLIAAAKLATLTQDGKKETLSASESVVVLDAMKAFDEVVTSFAPHDRCDSSRKRLFDDLIPRYGFEKDFKVAQASEIPANSRPSAQ